MRIALAQTAPTHGDVAANIEAHLKLIGMAVEAGANLIVFPELSITGYEPTLAKELAMPPDDYRFSVFQKLSDENNIAIGIGAPLKKEEGITIGLLLFTPHKKRLAYSKEYLHSDEEPFFVPGQNNAALFDEREKASFAICYELSVPEHAKKAFRNGAEIYLASVAKTAGGVTRAHERLSAIAKQYSMTVAMVNCIGSCDGLICGGQSAAWNNKGGLLRQLDESREGLLLVDTEAGLAMEKYF